MMLTLFAKNNNLQYVDPTEAEIALTYDFYFEYLHKTSREFLIIAFVSLIFPIYSFTTSFIGGFSYTEAILLSIFVLALDIWLIICTIRYREYISAIQKGQFKLAYVPVQNVGIIYTLSTKCRQNTLSTKCRPIGGCLWYEAPNKQGKITTWTARLPDKTAKKLQYAKIQKGFVISLEKQMEGMGVVIPADTEA